MLFCYEAGPCGYVLYRQLINAGHDCIVAAPSPVPRKPGEKIKNDRRDSLKLAEMLCAGTLTAVWVPDEEQEAMRDLVRVRQDMLGQRRKARQQLGAYVLRCGHTWPGGKEKWTQRYYNWLESLKFPHQFSHVVPGEYVNAVKEAEGRVEEISKQIELAGERWSLSAVVAALVSLRGIDRLSATILMAELGDISRFENPGQLFSFPGLVPTEHSSGGKRSQGGITRSGNRHARRIMVECAWSYRFPAGNTAYLRRKACDAPEYAREVAWRARKRLCGRYHKMSMDGKNTKVIIVAIARELPGFIRDIARKEMRAINGAMA